MNLVGVHGPNKKTKGKREENENFIIRINRKKNHRSFTEDYFKGKKIRSQKRSKESGKHWWDIIIVII